MGDGRGMVPDVVEALLVDGPHRAVADVVRARLRMVPEGARALDSAKASPKDGPARAQLTAAVAHLLASDEAFAQYLATTGLGRPADPPTVHLRTDPGTVQLRTGSLPPPASPTTVQLRAGAASPPAGPTTVQLRVDPVDARASALAARRSNIGIVVALVLVLIAAVVAIGIHLGSRPLLRPGGPGLAHAAQPLRDPALVQGVLPDARAVPGGWQVRSGPQSGTGTGGAVPCLLPDSCDRQLAYATVTFAAAVQSVALSVVTFDSPETAARAFDTTLDRTAGEDSGAVTLPRIGDQSATRTRGSSSAVALVRVDGVVLLVHDDGIGAAATAPVLTVFARLLADRARQAQDGRTPDAVARDTTG